MKTTINRLTYNTETAKEIANAYSSLPTSDFAHWEKTLYLTSKGAFFIYGWGGPMTEFAEACGNSTTGGHRIIPVTVEEALEWCEIYELEDAIQEHFQDLIEEA